MGATAGSDIWDGMPEDWDDSPEKKSEEKVTGTRGTNTTEQPITTGLPNVSNVPNGAMGTTGTVNGSASYIPPNSTNVEFITPPGGNVVHNTGTTTVSYGGGTAATTGTTPPPVQPGYGTTNEPDNKPKKRKSQKAEMKQYLERERKIKADRANYVREEIGKEKSGNRKDFIFIGIVSALLVCGIVAIIIIMSQQSFQKIYTLIDQKNYSLAYQEISDLHEKGRNVDDLVYKFATECANNSEYKRAVASLEFLSSKAESNKSFFENLVDIMLRHGKVNRAEDVLSYMESQGGSLETYANELYSKNYGKFTGGY